MSDLTVTIRHLANNASGVVREVTETGLPRIVTKNGKPVAVLAAIDDQQLAEALLRSIPDLLQGLDAALIERSAGGTKLSELED